MVRRHDAKRRVDLLTGRLHAAPCDVERVGYSLTQRTRHRTERKVEVKGGHMSPVGSKSR